MRLSLLIGVLFFSLNGFTQSEWNLEKSEDEIKVYVRDIPKTDFKQFKGIANIEASPDALFDLFVDFDNTKNWGYNLMHIEVLKRISSREFIVYYQVDMPWPLSDRDIINQIKITRDSDGGGKMVLTALPDYLAEKADFVRIKKAEGFYLVEPISEKKSKLTYQYYANPEGLPAWVVNSFITDSPFSTLTKIREEMKK